MSYTYDANKFKSVFEKSFTWLSGFMRNVSRHGDREALIDPATDTIWTYKTLNEDINRFANAMQTAGVKETDVVLYQLYNSPAFVFCYVAPQKLGAINSPANFNLSAGETANLLNRDKPAVYVYDADIAEMAQKALSIATHRPKVILMVDYHKKSPALPEGHLYFEDFVKGASPKNPDVDFTPDMYAEVTRLGTSGTTGTPKGVPLNNVNEVLSAHDVIIHFPLSPMDKTMNMTPWFHRGGLHSGGIVPTLFVGGTVVILRMFSAKLCFEITEKYGVTFLVGVPAALKNLATRQQKHPVDLSSLKGIVTMGSPLEKADCILYQEVLTKNIFNGYGTTETFWNTFLRPYDLPDKAGSAGTPCTGDEVRVVKIYEDKRAEPEDMVAQDDTEQGEVIIFAPEKSALSYYENEAETADRYYDGWFYTKDIATWDEEGFVSILGRKDDMIICMGENIYPAQLEEVINGCPLVSDCMVTGVDDPSRGQAVALYVIPTDDTVTIKDINRFCTQSDDISGYKVPRYYAFCDSLPYNATGKKLHYKLKEQAAKDLENGVLKRP